MAFSNFLFKFFQVSANDCKDFVEKNRIISFPFLIINQIKHPHNNLTKSQTNFALKKLKIKKKKKKQKQQQQQQHGEDDLPIAF